ncbi:hypothetical protein chiPu_0017778 [Chiloscyllium punctatum]|uniref:Ig-like domain-containing protein n=1 Tax=Chiloscyllium punctatum TaxID=137246 RepID=A0A401RIV3_CHIPU|nr:hypothetical protein [Chiloscyllium punctatum]
MDLQGAISSGLLVWTVILFVNTVTQAQATVLKVSSNHMVYTCPEGVNVTFKCSLSGHLKDRHDFLAKLWYYSRSKNALCKEKMHIRNTTVTWENHSPSKGHGVYMSSNHQGVFWVNLSNLVPDDEGIYCCVVHELHRSQPNIHHPKIELTVYGTMELQVTPGNGTHIANQKCTFRDHTEVSDTEGAHELVRMDSEAMGVENPVFEEIPAQSSEVKPRTLDIRRLPSDSDRHLLSEPNTPLSPETLPRFFPTLELVPDSPK